MIFQLIFLAGSIVFDIIELSNSRIAGFNQALTDAQGALNPSLNQIYSGREKLPLYDLL